MDELIYLLKKRARFTFEVQDWNGHTALHFMAKKGHLSGCQTLVEEFPQMLSMTNCFGDTPFHSAVQESRTDICNLFLEQSTVNYPIQNYGKRTLLLESIQYSELDLKKKNKK